MQRVWPASRERLPFRTPGSVPHLGLANAPIVETKFLELAMSLFDFSPRIPLGTFSILPFMNSQIRSNSGVAEIWSLYEEGLSDPNTQTIDIKSGIRAENLAMTYDLWPENVYLSCLLYPLLCI